MDGDSKPYFRRYCYDFPQDTKLFGWYLSNHHWHNGYYSVPQLKMTLLVLS
jgi:hypothetical protein